MKLLADGQTKRKGCGCGYQNKGHLWGESGSVGFIITSHSLRRTNPLDEPTDECAIDTERSWLFEAARSLRSLLPFGGCGLQLLPFSQESTSGGYPTGPTLEQKNAGHGCWNHPAAMDFGRALFSHTATHQLLRGRLSKFLRRFFFKDLLIEVLVRKCISIDSLVEVFLWRELGAGPHRNLVCSSKIETKR